MSLLELRNISVRYGAIPALRNVSLDAREGEIVCLLGGNASGKTTTLKTILGYVTPTEGEVRLAGERVNGLPTERLVQLGASMVPENRRLFKRMTVRENLELGCYLRRGRSAIAEDLERIAELFPSLRSRLDQRAGRLSGGEQQMVAVGRALMSRPRLLLMDEPSMGLAPALVEQSFRVIEQLRQEGTTIVLVEQNAKMALAIAQRGYVLQTGRIVLADTAANLLADPKMREAYLGPL